MTCLAAVRTVRGEGLKAFKKLRRSQLSQRGSSRYPERKSKMIAALFHLSPIQKMLTVTAAEDHTTQTRPYPTTSCDSSI